MKPAENDVLESPTTLITDKMLPHEYGHSVHLQLMRFVPKGTPANHRVIDSKGSMMGIGGLSSSRLAICFVYPFCNAREPVIIFRFFDNSSQSFNIKSQRPIHPYLQNRDVKT